MNKIYLKLLAVMVFWGTAFVSGRMLAQRYHPFCVAYIRFFLASLVLIPLYVKNKKGQIKITGQHFFYFLFLASTGVFAYNLFFLSGLKLVEAGRSSIIISVNPVITTFFAVFLYKEAFNWQKGVGMILAFFGLLLVLTHGHVSHLFTGEFGRGEIYLLFAVFSWVAYTLFGKKVMKSISPLESTAWASFLGSFMILPLALQHQLLSSLHQVTLVDLLNFSNLGIFSTCFGFIWYYQGVREIGAAKTSSFINLLPLIGTTFGVLFLGETVQLTTIIGGILVISGIIIINKRNEQKMGFIAKR